jgi:hypothetical protein
MNPAVRRLLAQRGPQGFPEHVEDPTVLARVAELLDNDNGAGPQTSAAAHTEAPRTARTRSRANRKRKARAE